LNNGLTEDNVTVVPFDDYQDNDNVTIYSNHPEQFKQQILNNQAIVEKIKIIFDDGSVDDDTFFPKLEKILDTTDHSECPTESKS